MPARFTSLNNQLEKGLDSVKPDAAIKQIEYWENELKDVDVSGVKTLLHDLEALKKLLHAETPDEAKIKTLVGKIGGETTRIGGRADEKTADKVKELGEKLEKAAA